MIIFEKLLIDYFEGRMTHRERVDFLRSVKSDENLKSRFIEFQNTHSLTLLITGAQDKKKGKEGYRRFKHLNKNKALLRGLKKTLAYAASAAILVFLTWTTLQYDNGQSKSNDQMHEVYAPSGQRTRLTLDDGTVVWLNAQSSLTYSPDFSENERKVILTGEAYFEVVYNPAKPFTVSTSDIQITVLGTTFNVNNYPETNYTQVSLIDGHLVVTNGKEEVFLKSNEELLCVNNSMTIGKIADPEYFLWKDGIYSFTNIPLHEIFSKLERYYDMPIKVENLPILEMEYTVKFRQQDGLDMALRMIQKTYPFKIEKKEDYIILKK